MIDFPNLNKKNILLKEFEKDIFTYLYQKDTIFYEKRLFSSVSSFYELKKIHNSSHIKRTAVAFWLNIQLTENH